ncbi:MAG TPA: acyl-CoA dehydrogenase family protein [Acidimicrobiales bacterium]|nr:acyl-CoA dehydrogenase family protein [Acidimicrobiales bacterium]
MIDYAALDSSIGHDWYELDPDLRARVARDCPADDRDYTEAKLHDFGTLIGTRIAPNAEVIDANPPQLVRFDRWANEIGTIEHHPATIDSKQALWASGYVSGFAADEKQRGRPSPGVVYAGTSYLLSQADTGLVCSTGMTGGVAGLVAAYAPPDVRDRLLAGLRADTFEDGLDGSMFLTERDGGSDLGRTVHCTARDIGDGRVLIDGEKWFCSNIDGAAIVMLARPEGAVDGPRGLGLYLVPRYLDDGTPNNYTMRRLKPKLGTKSVPTGEVEFEGAVGYALRGREGAGGEAGRRPGEEGRGTNSDAGGLNRMMEMVNGSRFGIAMMGLGIARRCFLEAAIWAHHRQAKGRFLVDLPLAREQLVDMQADLEAAFALGFECSAASRQADGLRLRRILIPAAKVRLCRYGIEAATLAIEFHGGNGYCEDWHLTRQLRDAQCHTIWEGTDNICALDVLRAIRRDEAHHAAFDRIETALTAAATSGPGFVTSAVETVAHAVAQLHSRVDKLGDLDPDTAEAGAGRLTNLLATTVSAALLLEQSVDNPRKALVAVRYTRRHLNGGGWDDHIAEVAGRDILAHADISEKEAATAAA